MKAALFSVLMLVSAAAFADNLTARDQAGNYVTLMSDACVVGPWLKEWKTAVFLYKGKQYEACWKLQGTTVVILDSAGEVTPLPAGAFKVEVKS